MVVRIIIEFVGHFVAIGHIMVIEVGVIGHIMIIGHIMVIVGIRYIMVARHKVMGHFVVSHNLIINHIVAVVPVGLPEVRIISLHRNYPIVSHRLPQLTGHSIGLEIEERLI